MNGEEAAARHRGADVDAAGENALLAVAADERAACRAENAQSPAGAAVPGILHLS